ncbi:ATP-binding protein [Nonomuraea sp. NPDC005983]|uniref:ATP-binding protein n=1 Tax=Nonomuraea sp. NPDC005983 TaxID=3155595 RepID=UPI0033B62CE1
MTWRRPHNPAYSPRRRPSLLWRRARGLASSRLWRRARDLASTPLPAGAASVRLRATVAATLVVAVALGAAAAILATVLRGSLQNSADADAARRAVAAMPMAQTVTLASPVESTDPSHTTRLPTTTATPETSASPATPGTAARDATSSTTTIPATPGTTRSDARSEGTAEAIEPALPLGVVSGTAQRVSDPDVWLTRDDISVEAAQTQNFAVAGMQVNTRNGPAMLWARASLDGADQALDTLNRALLPGVPALLLVVAGMTWFSVGRALAPVAAIRAKVADITARDLHQRVPVPRSGDEIAALATTVNGTLDRLETAVETHKRFVADAAHELRSPMATLRARLELAEPSELTREALADVERLQSLAADLLLLAKLDAGEPLRAKDLDLGQVAAEESLRRVHTETGAGRAGHDGVAVRGRPEVGLRLEVEPDVVIQGAQGHVGRLVTNLVDNAVRHAASMVRVRVRRDGAEAVLEVLDDGPGIPVEQREAVFDRFTRLDEARARDAGGAGLGLAIARDIAVLHGGTLEAVDGGLVAKFPLNQEITTERVNGGRRQSCSHAVH